LFTPPGAGCAEITISRGEGKIIDPEPFIRQLGKDLIKVYSPFTYGIAVLLFAGYLTGMTAGTILVFNH
jgi:hypothetical protein